MSKVRNIAVSTIAIISIANTLGSLYLSQKQNTDNTASSIEHVDAGTTDIQNNSIITTVSEQSISQQESVTFTETKLSTDTNSVSETTNSSVEESHVPVPVKNIDTVDREFDGFDYRCLQYDPSEQAIYYISNRQTVKKYNLNNNNTEIIASFDEYTELYCLSFNTHTNLLYASAVKRDNSNFVRVPWFLELTKGSNTHYQMQIGHVFFLDNKNALLTRDNSCSLFDISSGKVKQSGRVISGLNAYDCMIPFVHNNSYYYLTQIYGNWNIYRTIQAIPAESLTSDQSIPLSSKSEDILCATSSEDGVYYLSSDLNYCKLNLDRINNSGAENMDDEVLIRGDIIENNASNYLSKSSSQLQYVSDSCFIAFDESDRTIKLVGQLPPPSEKN